MPQETRVGFHVGHSGLPEGFRGDLVDGCVIGKLGGRSHAAQEDVIIIRVRAAFQHVVRQLGRQQSRQRQGDRVVRLLLDE